MNWLNYHHLFYFYTIATEGGIARASEKLNLGQPTLSAQLRQLEEMMGSPLFERRNRKMILTDAGRATFEYASEIFRLGDELLEVLQDKTFENQTHLQIGALDSVPKEIISQLVIEAYKVAPCSVSILEGRGDELFRELYAHRIDLILSNYPPPISEQKQIYSKSIAKLAVAVFGAPSYKELKKDFPRSLSKKPFVLPTAHSKLRHDLTHYFKLQEIQFISVAETQDTSLQKLLAMKGIGLAPLSILENKSNDFDDKLNQLGILNGIYEEVWLISAQRRLENPIASKLVKNFVLK